MKSRDEFCAAASDLVAATRDAPRTSTPTTIHDGLQKLQQLYQRMARAGTSASGSDEWSKTAEAYGSTLRRFDSNHRSTADDQFIFLLAQAVQRQNDAVGRWRTVVQHQCEVDLAPLYVSGQR